MRESEGKRGDHKVVARTHPFAGGEVSAKLRRREDDDDVRDDEAKMKAWSTWSGTARVDVKE